MQPAAAPAEPGDIRAYAAGQPA